MNSNESEVRSERSATAMERWSDEATLRTSGTRSACTLCFLFEEYDHEYTLITMIINQYLNYRGFHWCYTFLNLQLKKIKKYRSTASCVEIGNLKVIVRLKSLKTAFLNDFLVC